MKEDFEEDSYLSGEEKCHEHNFPQELGSFEAMTTPKNRRKTTPYGTVRNNCISCKKTRNGWESIISDGNSHTTCWKTKNGWESTTDIKNEIRSNTKCEYGYGWLG